MKFLNFAMQSIILDSPRNPTSSRWHLCKSLWTEFHESHCEIRYRVTLNLTACVRRSHCDRRPSSTSGLSRSYDEYYYSMILDSNLTGSPCRSTLQSHCLAAGLTRPLWNLTCYPVCFCSRNCRSSNYRHRAYGALGTDPAKPSNPNNTRVAWVCTSAVAPSSAR